ADVNISAGGTATHSRDSGNTGAAGGNETRPINVYLYYIVKVKGPVNEVMFSQEKKLLVVRARKTSSQVIPNNTATTIVYDDELEDNFSAYNNSTGAFTCPHIGEFEVGYNVYLENLDPDT